MKKAFYLVILSCFLLLNFPSCTPPIAEASKAIDPSMIPSSPSLVQAIKSENHWLGWFNAGDINIKVKPDKEVLPEKPAQAPDLSKIQKEPGKFRLVAVGGSLSAGFRDGGLYREGQLTAFPNLIAGQMKVGFIQPLFSQIEGNGTGYKTISSTDGPLVKFNMVTNNLGVTQQNGETAYSDFIEKDKAQIDQLAFPEIQKGLQFFRYPSEEFKYYKYIDRVAGEETKAQYAKPWDWVNDQNADLFIFEFGMDDTFKSASYGGGSIASGGQLPYYFTPEYELARSLAKKQHKGVILNVPEVLDFPYFKQITAEMVKKSGVKLFVEQYEYDATLHRLIPTPTIEKLLKGELKANVWGRVVLSTHDVITGNDFNSELQRLSPQLYNTYFIGTAAKDTGWPVVDIYSLYKRIQAGGYVTDDDVAVNPAWPRGGNFFSADGVYPTAFGQAVIANEVIKTLNKHYGLQIQLLQTRFFMGK
ncbi:hypothetical protein [Runella limosa]|uniref:hypothetical protein n=1 Tax=Runella limosa TaxID=370978 RepID=UPI00048BC993|nr:hypothetical protein [Runella limosa]